MRDNAKYLCPKCGGKCHQMATIYFARYDMRTDVFEVFANRICATCAYEWIEFERTIVPRDQKPNLFS